MDWSLNPVERPPKRRVASGSFPRPRSKSGSVRSRKKGSSRQHRRRRQRKPTRCTDAAGRRQALRAVPACTSQGQRSASGQAFQGAGRASSAGGDADCSLQDATHDHRPHPPQHGKHRHAATAPGQLEGQARGELCDLQGRARHHLPGNEAACLERLAHERGGHGQQARAAAVAIPANQDARSPPLLTRDAVSPTECPTQLQPPRHRPGSRQCPTRLQPTKRHPRPPPRPTRLRTASFTRQTTPPASRRSIAVPSWPPWRKRTGPTPRQRARRVQSRCGLRPPGS